MNIFAEPPDMLGARVIEFDPQSKRVQCWWGECDDQAEVLVVFGEDPRFDAIDFVGFLLLCSAHYEPLHKIEVP